MTSTADILRLLHRIHRQLADLRGRLDRGPRVIKAHKANVAALETEQAEAKQAATSARMAADQKQLQLITGETKIADLRTKLNTCSTNREYQALLEQIAADEMANSVLEDEILEALEKIETLQMAIVDAERKVTGGKEEMVKSEQAVCAEADTLKAEVARLETELTEAEKELPEDIQSDYHRIVKTRGEESMAAVEGDICVGCYQQITPNMVNILLMGQIVICKSCGRLLYVAEES